MAGQHPKLLSLPRSHEIGKVQTESRTQTYEASTGHQAWTKCLSQTTVFIYHFLPGKASQESCLQEGDGLALSLDCSNPPGDIAIPPS